MGNLLNKHPLAFSFNQVTKLSIVSLLISLSSAMVGTFWAIFLDGYLDSISAVGMLSGFLAVVSFLSYFAFIPLVQKSNKSVLFLISLLVVAFCYLMFAMNLHLYVFLVVVLIFTSILALRTSSFGLIVKDSSRKEELSKNEGLRYTFSNISFVVGPLLAGYVLSAAGIRYAFIVASIVSLIAVLFFWESGIWVDKRASKIDKGMLKNFFSFFRGKDKILAYTLRGGMVFWWSLIYMFIPLYMIRSGLSEGKVGYFLFAAAVPLILFEYFFAQSAGKKGFKKIFANGFLIAGIFALTCFFVSDIYLILVLLVLSSIGLAMLEPTSEAYFFDILSESEEYRFYGPFNTSGDVGSFLARVLGGFLLFFLPFKFIFLFFAGFMFLMALVSLRVRDVVEAK